MADPIEVIPFQPLELINDIFYSNRRLFNVKNSDNSISVGYLTNQTNENDQIINLEGVGNLAILGSFGSDSRTYTPGQLSLDEASLTNGNNRISHAIFNDPNYYSLITNTITEFTQSNDSFGIDGFGDSSVSRAVVSSPTKIGPQNTYSGGIRYPLNINKDQDYVKFNVVKLNTRSLGTVSGLSGTLNSNTYTQITTAEAGPVIIGTQAPIYDRLSVNWGDDSLNALQLAAANFSVNMATSSGAKEVKETFNAAYEQTGLSINENANGIAGVLGGLAAGLNPAAVFSRSQRKIINPNLELLFSGPALRPFNFTFKFAAREIDEATNIKKIIKFFKQNMVPRVENDAGLFLQAPYVFTIQYMNGSENVHKSINLISESPTKKACALISCDVNYTPLGTYMTFADDPEATMVAYELNLQFQEIEPIYSSDYDKGPGKDHSIGY